MKTLIIAAAAVLAAPAALAANSSSGTHQGPTIHQGGGGGEPTDTSLLRQCAMLSQQFDQAKAAHQADKSYNQALTLDTEGKTLCKSGNKQAAGVQYLHSAMKLIGIKANI